MSEEGAQSLSNRTRSEERGAIASPTTTQPSFLPTEADITRENHAPEVVGSIPRPRTLTFSHGLALLVGLQIGAGIFASPSAIFTGVGSSGSALLVWLLAGILAWTGAASFTELGSVIPLNGGMQEYLRYCYNDAAGFLVAWTWVLVVIPCSTAMLSLTFSEYLYRAFAFEGMPSIWAVRGIAWLTNILITCLNCLGTRASTDTTNVFFVLKLTGLLSIIGTGIVLLTSDSYHQPDTLPIPGQSPSSSLWGHLGAYADATLAALWAYSGWEVLGMVAGELENPSRNIPLVINSAMFIVVSLFLMANVGYSIVLPIAELQKTNTIALDFGYKAFGTTGLLFYAWVVCVSCLGGLNVKAFTAGRLTEAAVQRNYLPAFLTTHPSSVQIGDEIGERQPPLPIRGQRPSVSVADSIIPVNAMLLNLFLSTLYLIIGDFRFFLIFIGMAESVTLFMAVAGVLVLRVRVRNDSSSILYRTRVINPLTYCTVLAAVITRSVIKHPIEGILIMVFNLIGVGLYKIRWRSGLFRAVSDVA